VPRAGRVFFDGAVYRVYNRIARGEHALGVDVSQLARRGPGEATVRARELLASLGAERFDLQVNAIGEALDKHPATASGWVMRGIRRWQDDEEFKARYDKLERILSSP